MRESASRVSSAGPHFLTRLPPSRRRSSRRTASAVISLDDTDDSSRCLSLDRVLLQPQRAPMREAT